MKIEAVTVCIDFADKLKQVISNKNKLDRWVIATHTSDNDTINLCIENNIEYICSDRVFDNASFAKGRAINDALEILDKDDWLLHLDADQLLPKNFRDIIVSECNDTTKLYGCKREDSSGKIMDYGQKQVTWSVRGGKIRANRKQLILPIGYFQLWHSSIRKTYFENSETGDKDDMTFMNYWLRMSPDIKQNIKILSANTRDVSEHQGHYRGHFVGIRNLKQK